MNAPDPTTAPATATEDAGFVLWRRVGGEHAPWQVVTRRWTESECRDCIRRGGKWVVLPAGVKPDGKTACGR